MVKLSPTLVTILFSIVILAVFLTPVFVVSQSTNSQVDLNQVIRDVQRAESSGATPSEMQNLTAQLNSVLTLQDELRSLPTQDESARTSIMGQINSTLASVDGEAYQIQVAGSRRSYLQHSVLYSSGLIAAIVVTLVYHYGFLYLRRRRISKAMRMKVGPKPED